MSARMKRREFITPLGDAAEGARRIARGDGNVEGH
jgi:hypothetical protein